MIKSDDKMEPEWMDKVYPANLGDYIGNFYAVNIFEKWIKGFNQDSVNGGKKINKVLFVWGKTGSGKTCLVELILKKYNYQSSELNNTNIKSHKSLGDFIKKYKATSNIGKYFIKDYQKKCIVIEELDVMISEKGCMQEISKLLSDNIINTIPIIIVSTNIDKKLGELVKKYKCEQVKILPPSKADFFLRVEKYCEDYNIKLNEDSISLIINTISNDYRHLLTLLYNIKLKSLDYEITENNSEEFIRKILENYSKKIINLNLFDTTKRILYNNSDIDEIFRLYDTDKLLLLLMIHENYKIPITSSKMSFKDKIKTLTKISNNLSDADIHERIAYTEHIWDCYKYSGLHSCIFINNIYKSIEYKKNCDILFTNYLSKSSTYASKNKLLNYMYDLNKNIQCDPVNIIDIISCKLKYMTDQNEKNKLLHNVKITPDNYNKILSISTVCSESDYKMKKTTKNKSK